MSATDATQRVNRGRTESESPMNATGGGQRSPGISTAIVPPGACRAYYNTQACPYGDKCKYTHIEKPGGSTVEERRSLRSGKVLSVHISDIEKLAEILETESLEDSADILRSIVDEREAAAEEDIVV